MPSNFGPRNTTEPASSPSRTTSPGSRGGDGPLRFSMATSRLVVVRAITAALVRGAEVSGAALRPALVELPWSDGLIAQVATGSVDAVIYNQARGLDLIRDDGPVRFAGTLGHSMGGRNFGVLAARDGRWGDLRLGELRARFSEATVIVGRATDRFSNLLDVLGLADERDLDERGITVLDIADAPCAALRGLRDGIMIVGQNRRYEARNDPTIVEIGGFEDLPSDVQTALRRRSANALFVATRLESEAGMTAEDLRLAVWQQVASEWFGAPGELVRAVAEESEFDEISLSQRIEAVTEIVYTTYRFGGPDWNARSDEAGL